MLKRFFLLTWIALSLFLVWFALGNYRASRSIAEENLSGLAHSLTDAIEGIAARDPSLRALSGFHPADIAFFAVIDGKGSFVFHTNPDLVGTPSQDGKSAQVIRNNSSLESRVTLGTGENAYEFYTPFYLPGETLVLHLTLHTYRADAVIRRAELNMGFIFLLLAAGWFLLIVLYRYSLREERHRLEMERQERLAQLGEMGAMLAHEIRNPLAGIKGYAQVIEKRPQESRNAGFAQGIVKEVLRLEHLVTDLLSYAKTDPTPPAPIDVGALAGSVALLIKPEAEQQHVALSITSRGVTSLAGNSDKLRQVLLNLMKNSLQAMPEGGRLDIGVDGSGKAVVVSVADSGEGIAPEQMERVFEPFFTTKARGTGLGLALCKKIVEEHGGTIQLRSSPGSGTTVNISLPRKRRGGSQQ